MLTRIVGWVAVTDKHVWISGDQLINDPHLLFEDYDGWKTQFAAGIRTISVVGVVPHGVIQLGSLKNVSILNIFHLSKITDPGKFEDSKRHQRDQCNKVLGYKEP